MGGKVVRRLSIRDLFLMMAWIAAMLAVGRGVALSPAPYSGAFMFGSLALTVIGLVWIFRTNS